MELWEVSLVTFPANTLARIMAVKSKFAAGEIPSFSEMERFLSQECGMSLKESQLLLKSGYDAYVAFVSAQRAATSEIPEESDEALTFSEKQLDELTSILKSF